VDRRGRHQLAEAAGGGHLHEVVAGLARHGNLPALERRHDRRLVVALFAFVNGLLSIGVISAVAWATDAPFVFPSLGPTAFLLFYTPLAPSASPRNTICGHAIACVAGFGALAAFGLLHAAPNLAGGVSPDRIGAAAVSLAVTAGVMAWLSLAHPPAGATTLIVSLGVLSTPGQIGVLMLGVVMISAQGLLTNRAAGLDYPWWSPHPQIPGAPGTLPPPPEDPPWTRRRPAGPGRRRSADDTDGDGRVRDRPQTSIYQE
jgi:CBS-domain-containing membrane protein